MLLKQSFNDLARVGIEAGKYRPILTECGGAYIANVGQRVPASYRNHKLIVPYRFTG